MKFPSNHKILFIVDTNLSTVQNISQMCKTHELVIMIDHHTSFKDMKKELDE